MEPLRLADRENDTAGPFGYEDASIESDEGITSAMNVFLKKHRMTLNYARASCWGAVAEWV